MYPYQWVWYILYPKSCNFQIIDCKEMLNKWLGSASKHPRVFHKAPHQKSSTPNNRTICIVKWGTKKHHECILKRIFSHRRVFHQARNQRSSMHNKITICIVGILKYMFSPILKRVICIKANVKFFTACIFKRNITCNRKVHT